MQKGMGEDIALFIQFFTTFVFGFALGFWQGWELTLLLLGIAPVLAACGALMMKLISGSQSAEQLAYGEAGAVVSEVLAGLRTVVGLGAEQQMLNRYSDKLVNATQAEIKNGWFQGLGMGVTWSLFFFAYGASFRFGFWLIHHNDDWSGGKIMMVMLSVLPR
jgi:ABC-type multidrug transport system fused ATPase/permease subunit